MNGAKKTSLKNHITLSKIEISTNGSNLARGNAFRTASYHSLSNSFTHLRENVSRWRGPSSEPDTDTDTDDTATDTDDTDDDDDMVTTIYPSILWMMGIKRQF